MTLRSLSVLKHFLKLAKSLVSLLKFRGRAIDKSVTDLKPELFKSATVLALILKDSQVLAMLTKRPQWSSIGGAKHRLSRAVRVKASCKYQRMKLTGIVKNKCTCHT